MSLVENFLKTNKLEKVKLSTSSLGFLNQTITFMREIQIPPHAVSVVPLAQIVKGTMWTYIPLVLRNKIESSLIRSHKTLSIFRIRNTTIQVNVLGGSLQEHKTTIMFIYKYLFFILPFCPSECTHKTLNIYIYLIPDTKILPRRGPIDEINANSAFTTTCHPNNASNEITIFRREEWFKVFIHETFHILGLDFSGSSWGESSFVNEILREMVGLPTADYRIYESYCEICAELLNILFYCSLRPRTTDAHLRELISLEKTFSLFQWKKILKYNNVHPMDLSHYREKTSVFSYYALKGLGLYYLDDFIQLFLNKKNPFLFDKTKENILKYILFFNERYGRKEFLSSIEKINIDPTQTTLNGTLRMTLVTPE
jgi:hypothetical protein